MIGCLYIPDYPAWALQYLDEQHDTASESGLAVVNENRVLASTQAAQQAGVASGMTRAEAERTAVSIRERDPRAEAAVWVDVMQRLNAYTPRIEPVDTGLLYFDLVDAEALSDFLQATGVQATWAPDRPAARLGALCARPGMLQRLTHRDITALVHKLRIEQLLRLDYPLPMIMHLKDAGYDRLGALQEVSRRRLKTEFGTQGKRLHRLLHPSRVDRAPVPLYTAPDTVRRALHWDTPAVYWEQVQPALARLLSQAVSALGAKTCQRITVHAVDACSGAVLCGSRLLHTPRRTRSALSPVAHELLRALMQTKPEVATLRIALGVLAIPEVYPDVFFRQALRPHCAASSRMARASVADDTVLDERPEHGEVVGDGRAQIRR